MSSEPPREDTHRVAVVVRDESLQERILSLLEEADLEVAPVRPGADVWRRLRSTPADLVLVRRSQLPQDDRRLLDALGTGEGSEPGIVVLDDAGDPGDRARLMAAGVASIIDPNMPRAELGRTIEALAAAGGDVHEPGVRGTVATPRIADFFSHSPRMAEFLGLVRRVVDSDVTLLVCGETGVGKERLARAIHAEGPRAAGPFVAVNIGALPETLLESELFGHETGAFTGAERLRRGWFEQAQGGTILLDEIGDLPLHLQVKLLTVLQRHEVRRVGGDRPVPVDVRIIAATNRDLAAEVRRGHFREDLFYRLNVVPLEIPPLRERREDVPDVVGRFISHFRESLGRPEVKGISEAAVRALMRYDWPGNTREVINVIERAVLLCGSDRITLDELPPAIVTGSGPPPAGTDPAGPEDDAAVLERPLAEVRRSAAERAERAYLVLALERTGGRVGETARIAGITPRALYERMKRHDLRKEDFRPPRRG